MTEQCGKVTHEGGLRILLFHGEGKTPHHRRSSFKVPTNDDGKDVGIE